MAWLFIEYEVHVARNSQVLHWNFSIPHATSYSVKGQATVHLACVFVVVKSSFVGFRGF